MPDGSDELITPLSADNRCQPAARISFHATDNAKEGAKEGANKRGNSSRLTQSFHFFMFEPIFSPVNALNQPI
ncbi:hypothetical protein C3418_22925 [Aeromonas sp. ASNIH8]|nr:hypothetical protein C2U47_16950 [Aeromonas sp. ASNIH7]POV84710.1 hypothetical protein C3418_22925 [Aeromonas sp. ASNIH8]